MSQASTLLFLAGNPRSEVKTGVIETFCPIADINSNKNCKETSKIKSDNLSYITENESTLLALVCIPSTFEIPSDIIKFFASYLDRIVSFTIVRHYYDPEKYICIILIESVDAATQFMKDFFGLSMCSLDPTTCILYTVKSISYTNSGHLPDIAAQSFGNMARSPRHNNVEVLVWHGEQSKSPITSSPANLFRIRGLISERDEKYSKYSSSPKGSPVSIPAESHLLELKENNNVLGEAVDVEDDDCTICYEPISRIDPRSFTTCCCHTFHINCMSRLSGPECPLCRCVNIC